MSKAKYIAIDPTTASSDERYRFRHIYVLVGDTYRFHSVVHKDNVERVIADLVRQDEKRSEERMVFASGVEFARGGPVPQVTINNPQPRMVEKYATRDEVQERFSKVHGRLGTLEATVRRLDRVSDVVSDQAASTDREVRQHGRWISSQAETVRKANAKASGALAVAVLAGLGTIASIVSQVVA